MCRSGRTSTSPRAPQEDQRTYLLVLSQPGISLCGLLAWNPDALRVTAADSTPESLMASVDRLVAARFLVVDYDTDELLVRSFIRYDGVWRNSRTRTGMMGQRASDVRASPGGDRRRDRPGAVR